MLGLYEKLQVREKENNPIRVAVIGAGQMGGRIVDVISHMPGMRAVLVADVMIERARTAYISAGIDEKQQALFDDPILADRAVAGGYHVVTTDGSIAPFMKTVDVVIEATGLPEIGANIALKCITEKKHIVMMNVETDVVVGPLLKKLADSAGIIYTGAAGDEPAATKELYDFATTMGLEVIAAGKGKNTPLNREANPDNVFEIAPKFKNNKSINPRMLVEFVDGSKTMIEMTALANATGLTPEIRGMYGPNVQVADLEKVFCLKDDGGILRETGVVDYGIGIAPGVFVVVKSSYQASKEMFSEMGSHNKGYYTLYRPYHLTCLEVPMSAARAVIYHEPTIAPREIPSAETITVAKRDLKAGEKIDGLGGFSVYGSIEKATVARAEQLLPLGLSPGAVLKKDVAKGTVLKYEDVELKEGSVIVELRRLQDALIYNK